MTGAKEIHYSPNGKSYAKLCAILAANWNCVIYECVAAKVRCFGCGSKVGLLLVFVVGVVAVS